ncbi:MAG: hypothetical protein FJX68_19540 [Alphaproteobacteria bacterium]|nr:hypothetical protein [Alphaproteobacteria bacterium]
MTQAFKHAEASALMPFDFLRLIWSSALGLLVFAEVPDLLTWTGGAVIFAAGSCAAYGETRSGGKAPAAKS